MARPCFRLVATPLALLLAIALLPACSDDCDSPETIVGILTFPGDVELRSQADVDLLAGLVSIQGSLTIGGWSSDPIVDLRPLASLQKIEGSLRIEYARELVDLAGLERVNDITYLKVEGCNRLRSFRGLPTHQRYFFRADITDCDSLLSLQGFDANTPVSELSISGCPALTSLEALDGLVWLESLHLVENQSLVRLPDLGAESHLANLLITDCGGLTSLAGFSGPATLNRVTIADNDQLAALTGLEWTIRCEDLNITGNTLLSSLAGLDGLTEIGPWGLEIASNPVLDTCLAEEWAGELVVEGTVSISGNGKCKE